MGYVKEDAPDLFISYSRGGRPGGRRGKETRLGNGSGTPTPVSEIGTQSSVRPVRAISGWINRLAAGDELDASLDGKVRDSAAMLIVLSPGYRESSWCKREMDLFLSIAEAKPMARSKSRVFVIETDRVERPERWRK